MARWLPYISIFNTERGIGVTMLMDCPVLRYAQMQPGWLDDKMMIHPGRKRPATFELSKV